MNTEKRDSIRFAGELDIDKIASFDSHIQKRELHRSVSLKRVLVAEEGGKFAGWLRWNLFWDNTPFMILLFVFDEYRNKGYGRALISHWEELMRQEGHRTVMMSTQSDETAQHMYRRLGYVDSGALLLPGEPLEIIFAKTL